MGQLAPSGRPVKFPMPAATPAWTPGVTTAWTSSRTSDPPCLAPRTMLLAIQSPSGDPTSQLWKTHSCKEALQDPIKQGPSQEPDPAASLPWGPLSRVPIGLAFPSFPCGLCLHLELWYGFSCVSGFFFFFKLNLRLNPGCFC
jgi:hypothetical protein